MATSAQISVSLREWIFLSARYECQQGKEEIRNLNLGHEDNHDPSSHDSHGIGAANNPNPSNPSAAAAAGNDSDESEINGFNDMVAERRVGNGSVSGHDARNQPSFAIGSTSKEANLSYLERATHVAFLLVNCLQDIEKKYTMHSENNASGTPNIKNFTLDNFYVSVGSKEEGSEGISEGRPSNEQIANAEDSILFQTKKVAHSTSIGDSLSEEKIKVLMEGDRQINFISFSPDNKQSSNGKQTLGDDHPPNHPNRSVFHKIGLILYNIFSRGHDPQMNLPRAETNLNENSKTESQLSRTFNSFQKMRLSNSNLQESLLEKGVPMSISRLVSDLILCGDSKGNGGVLKENEFESLEEVSAELNDILEQLKKPNHPSANKQGQLIFDHALIGREEELKCLLELARRVPAAGENVLNKVALVRGHSGIGKSLLVKSLKEPLVQSGWLYVEIKFDHMARSQPLPTIAAAFERFFRRAAVALSDERGNSNNDALAGEAEVMETIVASIRRHFSPSGIAALGTLIPSFSTLYPDIFANVVGSDCDNELKHGEHKIESNKAEGTSGLDEGVWGAEKIRNRLHYLFRSMVNIMASNPAHPLLLFVDDLQWADEGSLDILSTLVMESDFLQEYEDDPEFQFIFFVGSYRSDEVDYDHIVTDFVYQLEQWGAIDLTNVDVGGMTNTDANRMISRALGLPVRITRGLSDIIERKTLGSPFHIQEFLKSLVQEKILCYSLVEQRWIWDLEVVQNVAVQESVAELLTKNLMGLDANVQSALKVVSCFGTEASIPLLHLLHSFKISRNFLDVIEFAIGEKLLERHGDVVKFAHDRIAQGTYELMSDQEKGTRHFEIGTRLLSLVSNIHEQHSITTMGLTQINKAQAFGVSDPSKHVELANLNLKAGEWSRQLSDFSSALSHLQCGIKFLPESKWETNYELSLQLFESASLMCFICGFTSTMSELVEELFRNARCLEDKLKASLVMIQSLGSSGKQKEAISKSFEILEELGESFPQSDSSTMEIENSAVEATRSILKGITKDDILAAPRMVDTRKLWAVKFLNLVMNYLTMSRPKLAHLVSCRIIQISARFGYCSDSAFALVTCCYALIHRDTEECYRLGKTAISLLESFNARDLQPKLKCLFYSFLSVWVEPLQATSSTLLDIHKEALVAGDIECSMVCAFFYCRQSFMCGKYLVGLERECEAFRLKMNQFKQQHVSLSLFAHQLMLCQLTGSTLNPLQLLEYKISNEDELLVFAQSSGKVAMANFVYFSKLTVAFWFKQYENAAEMAKSYRRNFVVTLMDIYVTLFEGLTAFHLARCSDDTSECSKDSTKWQWLEIGRKALSACTEWEKHNEWSFENKRLLLEAEYYLSIGEFDLARRKYEASIESAKSHRFIHEQGIAMELFGSFLRKQGDDIEGAKQIGMAINFYELWGAARLCEFLRSFYREMI